VHAGCCGRTDACLHFSAHFSQALGSRDQASLECRAGDHNLGTTDPRRTR
jgi:hypothetical protein